MDSKAGREMGSVVANMVGSDCDPDMVRFAFKSLFLLSTSYVIFGKPWFPYLQNKDNKNNGGGGLGLACKIPSSDVIPGFNEVGRR